MVTTAASQQESPGFGSWLVCKGLGGFLLVSFHKATQIRWTGDTKLPLGVNVSALGWTGNLSRVLLHLPFSNQFFCDSHSGILKTSPQQATRCAPYLFHELLLYIVFFERLKEGKQWLFLADRAAAQHHGHTLQQGGLAVQCLILQVLWRAASLWTHECTEAQMTHKHKRSKRGNTDR